jgi:hypothetical protein
MLIRFDRAITICSEKNKEYNNGNRYQNNKYDLQQQEPGRF